MNKYDPLQNYLSNQYSDCIKISFDQIADLVDGLPPTAYSTEQWWANEKNESTRHVQSRAWVANGWKAKADLGVKSVEFTRRDGQNFGEIKGIEIGHDFENRISLGKSGIHRPHEAGICGVKYGAESIVLSDAYYDEDYGDEIIYTGQGGYDNKTRKQNENQELTRGNTGLSISSDEGIPVRVIRGSKGNPDYSPPKGYRYDGLYRVDSYWPESRDGFTIWRFRLIKIGESKSTHELPTGSRNPERRETLTSQIIRNPQNAIHVKKLHEYMCQFCKEKIVTPSGPYSEGAHIKPLGRPHNGPDMVDNLLCLCPNCHLKLDKFVVHIGEDGVSLFDTASGEKITEINLIEKHDINPENIEYQRELAKKAAGEFEKWNDEP